MTCHCGGVESIWPMGVLLGGYVSSSIDAQRPESIMLANALYGQSPPESIFPSFEGQRDGNNASWGSGGWHLPRGGNLYSRDHRLKLLREFAQ